MERGETLLPGERVLMSGEDVSSQSAAVRREGAGGVGVGVAVGKGEEGALCRHPLPGIQR